jgi:hypothetical protein
LLLPLPERTDQPLYLKDHGLCEKKPQNMNFVPLKFRGNLHAGDAFYGFSNAGGEKTGYTGGGVVIGKRHGAQTQGFRPGDDFLRGVGTVGEQRMGMQIAEHRIPPWKNG